MRQKFSFFHKKCALPNMENASLILIQGRAVCINSGSVKRFQDSDMRAIDFSHRKPSYRVILMKFGKKSQKSVNCL
jgi:hypothetical protein